VRVHNSFFDGPGQNLITDSAKTGDIFVGQSIVRQTFDTQFILDLNQAIGIEKERVFVTLVTKGKVHFTWEDTSVIVQFVFLERNATSELTLLQAIAKLTNDIQDANSKLYDSNTGVTKFIDKPYGLLVEGWDISVRLTYSIEIIGGNAVREGYFLNQGGMGICDLPGAENYAKYCEFERFFEDDISSALGISYYRIQIMFIKKAAYDASLIYFRVNPSLRGSNEKNISTAIGELAMQIHDPHSKLYNGNVTIRLDPVWGISQEPGTYTLRKSEARFTKKHYDHDITRLNSTKRMSLMTPYDRCKQNRRCNWGIVEIDQYTNDVKYYHQLYDRGYLFKTDLFLDFEDWRLGSRGFSWEGYIPPTAKGQTSIPKARAQDGFIRGSHFWPFDQASLGPDIPCYLKERNQGLVLDRSSHKVQIERQDALIDDIQGRIDFLGKNIEWADMGAELRSRKDVKANLSWVRYDFENWRDWEIIELHNLTSSQCTNVGCSLLFDTTTLKMVGAINGTGVIRKTEKGTEVAVFSFNSIYLGPEVKITVVGQRALSLVSKTAFIFNTSIHINPGTLGGFQGGQSIGRHVNDSLTDTPRSIYICDLTNTCLVEQRDNMTNAERLVLISNNANGPGSGNVRVRSFVVTTSAENIPEVQRITTTVQKGQTIEGGFILQFKDYSTTLISAHSTAEELKQILEKNLNIFTPDDIPVYPSRVGSARAGIGIVDVSRNYTGDDGQGWIQEFDVLDGQNKMGASCPSNSRRDD
jgi:tetrahydromethanopterin S-methyltransferase subunit F